MGNRQNLSTRIANQLLAAHAFTASGPQGAQALWTEAYPILRKRVKAMRPSDLGSIVASGPAWKPGEQRTGMYLVHCGTYIDKYASGRQVLHVLAMTAIVAEMWDIIKSRDPQRAEDTAAA
jgi:hypothetical protein